MDFSDPAKKQYLIFSFVISLIFGVILSFPLADLLEGPLVSGFPISISDMSGLGKFFAQVFNSVILGAILTVPVYYGLDWLQNRAR